MRYVIILLALGAGDPAVKVLPPVSEPDWAAWKDVDLEAKQPAMEAWSVLREFRPDRVYETDAEQEEAEGKVEAVYGVLDANPDAACAAGVELLRSAKSDWERMMVATTLDQLGGEQGEPFLVWAMAKCTSVDSAFEPLFYTACRLASKRREQYLPALFAVLRTRDGQVNLPVHAWSIPTHECLYYVFGRYGRDAIPYLRPMLDHSDPYVRRNAAFVLGFFMDKASKPALLKLLEAHDISSGGAAFALGELSASEAVVPLTKLLKHADARTRFWGAYGLYEICAVESLPALEAAAKDEHDAQTHGEMQATIDYLRSGPASSSDAAHSLGDDKLREALAKARKAKGLNGDLVGIVASSGCAELDQLEEIRLMTMDIPSDMGHKWFRRWTDVIKELRRRCD